MCYEWWGRGRRESGVCLVECIYRGGNSNILSYNEKLKRINGTKLNEVNGRELFYVVLWCLEGVAVIYLGNIWMEGREGYDYGHVHYYYKRIHNFGILQSRETLKTTRIIRRLKEALRSTFLHVCIILMGFNIVEKLLTM